MSSPRLTVLTTDDNRAASTQALDHTVNCISPELLTEAEVETDILIIDDRFLELAEVLDPIRKKAAWQAKLIYTVEETASSLTDGKWPGYSEACKAWGFWLEHSQQFNGGQLPATTDQQLLYYLWVREQGVISPARTLSSSCYYNYPLLDVFNNSGVSSSGWIKQLLRNNYLEPVELIDRLRLCPQCKSSHLNYIDLCPSCHSHTIEQAPSLHCFICGHVAPEASFRHEGCLVCPNCSSRLRHIGSDYDRPMENYRCQSCHQSFADAEVTSHCMACDTRSEPGNLLVEQIYSYRLSTQTRLALINGTLNQPRHEIDLKGEVGIGEFEHTVTLFRGLAKRYGEALQFTLVGIKVDNWDKALDQLGEAQIFTTLHALSDRLNELIRTTDLACRYQEELYWLFFPCTSAKGRAIVMTKVEELTENVQATSSNLLNFKVLFWESTEQDDLEETSELLLIRLTEKMDAEQNDAN